MTEKKYQIFISSTYEDLKDERKAVEEIIMRSGDLPVGMEAFPAADEEQFEFIKSVIDDSDYYILIIAGRYGSISEDGFSYTEKEYNYAVLKGVPVLVLLHGDRGALQAAKTEKSEEGRRKLEEFIKATTERRLRKTWTTLDGLKLAAREALDHAKRTKKRVGWVRGSEASSPELLAQIVQLQKENSELKERVSQSDADLNYGDNIANLDDIIFIRDDYSNEENSFKIGDIFLAIAEIIILPTNEHDVIDKLDKWFSKQLSDSRDENCINHKDLKKIQIHFMALQLIEVKRGGTLPIWSLTDRGRNELFRRAIIRSPKKI